MLCPNAALRCLLCCSSVCPRLVLPLNAVCDADDDATVVAGVKH